MKYEFDGISTDTLTDYDNDFTEVYDNVYIANKSFPVYLDNKEVQLYIYIEDMDMSEYEDSTDHVIRMGVIPSYNSLSEKNKEDILNQYLPEDRESMLKDTTGLLYEILSYGFSIDLRSETVKPDQAEYKIQSAKAVQTGVSGLIGFELDRYKNRIGNTGWDFLDNYCNDVDLIKLVLDRYESNKT